LGIKGTKFHTIDDLKGKRLAYLRGAKFSDAIDNDDSILKYETTNFRQGIKMLKKGRVDAIIGPLDPIISAAILSGSTDFLGEPLVVSERTPWLQLSNKSRALNAEAELTEHFKAILQRGSLKKLREKYLTH
jgi:polar amino acid transport system substrate-binding protein